MDVSQLRTDHPIFRYVRSSWQHDDQDVLTLRWEFSDGIHTFTPSLVFSTVTKTQISSVSQATLDWYAFQLGLVELLSYWKATAAPQIKIEAGQLTSQEQTWWNTLLINGLGEFFYQNQLDFTASNFVTWESTGPTYSPAPALPSQATALPRLLIPLGGGKDSAASLEVFLAAKSRGELAEAAILLINPTQAAQDLAQLSGLRVIEIDRHLDPVLFDLNTAGYLNGHTPFSAMAAWVSTLAAHLYGFSHIAVSNERSSNEGNILWHNREINHQYSKTYTFERDFQQYLTEHLGTPLGTPTAPLYFSFLRPLYELQIGKLFASVTESKPEVRSRFRSCNRGQKTNSWCGDCAKCLFAYLVLRPWITHDEMVQVFGRDVLENANLYHTLLELVGRATSKPFDCVGTHEESTCAAYLSLEAYRSEQRPIPVLLQQLESEVLSHEAELASRSASLLASWNTEHSVPDYFQNLLRSSL